jgi:branched-chain amino acid transport system ATP-binding protein
VTQALEDRRRLQDNLAAGRRVVPQSARGSAVGRLNFKEGVSLLLAEQNTNMALKYASHGYILESGRVVMDGEARALAANEDVKEFYLGVAGDKRKSFRDGKHYKRRKRWLA